MTTRQVRHTLTAALLALPFAGNAQQGSPSVYPSETGGSFASPTETEASSTPVTAPFATPASSTALTLYERFQADATNVNPASMPWYSAKTVTSFSLNGQTAKTARTLPVQLGDGSLLGSIEAASYRHLGANSTVWGNARFIAGKIRDIRWCNATDYLLLAPYVIGDAAGGDLTRRSYDFRGGYAMSLSGWSWGAEAAYRASLDYRGRDPRDKLIVSDLNLRIGATIRPKAWKYSLGLSGSARIYKQSVSIDFYNPINDINTYSMTGLGAFYHRFSGTSASTTAYTGSGFSGSLSLFPTDPVATANESPQLRGALSVGSMAMKQYLRDFNNLELTHSSTTRLSADFGILLGNWGVNLEGYYNKRTGTENLFGSATGSSYVQIGERRNYQSTAWMAAVSLPSQWQVGAANRLNVSLSAGFSHTEESLTEPVRTLAAGYITPGIAAGWHHTFNRTAVAEGQLPMALHIEASVARRFVPGGSVKMPDLAGVDDQIRPSVEQLADCTAADATYLRLGAGIDIPMKEEATLRVSARWLRNSFNRSCGNADIFTITVGVAL